jgi:hypothetical protein
MDSHSVIIGRARSRGDASGLFIPFC